MRLLNAHAIALTDYLEHLQEACGGGHIVHRGCICSGRLNVYVKYSYVYVCVYVFMYIKIKLYVYTYYIYRAAPMPTS